MIDDGAVGGSQILDGPTAGGGIGVDARMVGGNEFIIQHHGVRSGTAKCDGVAGQRDGTAGRQCKGLKSTSKMEIDGSSKWTCPSSSTESTTTF